ncbi:hypothetical protein [Streptomyces sp. NPDC007205]|uniref:hypothetical protein n=1 Tax=Streptomyces sp. NPDC007205 TaxID=3154316 RepID=UPI0033DC1DB5
MTETEYGGRRRLQRLTVVTVLAGEPIRADRADSPGAWSSGSATGVLRHSGGRLGDDTTVFAVRRIRQARGEDPEPGRLQS